MTATDEVSPTARVSPPLLTTEEPIVPDSHPVPTPSEYSHETPSIPSLNGDHTQSETPADPKIAALLAMFPDFDISLLQSVLESVSGNQDRAVDVLLGMSDPSYTSNERADVNQTELDEEIARRLMLEESEQQAAWQPTRSHVSSGHVPYQPRAGRTSSSDYQRPYEGDGGSPFQEQFGKFAETGKRTFNTLLSKVKAKIQEFDNPAGQAQPSTSSRSLPAGDSWNTPMQSQRTYYDPNHSASVQGYDLETPIPSGQPPTSSANQPVTAAQPMTSYMPGVSSSTTAPEAAANNVDHSKLGLLPRRSIALGSSAQPSRNLVDDEVEYVENPFEESAHR